MHSRAAVVVALAMLGTALAGCSGTKEVVASAAIKVENGGEPGGPGPYTFTAQVDAQGGNYTWDLGDHLTVLYGKSVTHTYDFASSAGNLTVTLKYRLGDVAKADQVGLRLGGGQNAVPTFVLDAETNWAVLGQTVKFSAARSSDPDHDPLRYSWACLTSIPDSLLVAKTPHNHGNVGTPYQTPPAGTVTSYLANASLPAATTTIPGDLCTALGTGTPPSTSATTIQGSFANRGAYTIFLLASDGPHATVSGSFQVFVTKPSEKPAAWVNKTWDPVLTAGGGGNLETPCETLPAPATQTNCDRFAGTLTLPLGALYGWVNSSYDSGLREQDQSQNNATWQFFRGTPQGTDCGGCALVAQNQCPNSRACRNPDSEFLPQRLVPASPYVLIVTLQSGAQVTVHLSVTIRLNLDPYTLWV